MTQEQILEKLLAPLIVTVFKNPQGEELTATTKLHDIAHASDPDTSCWGTVVTGGALFRSYLHLGGISEAKANHRKIVSEFQRCEEAPGWEIA